ncbi:MAG: hypothetical protein A2268_05025 [Candidatus Raymondbacteria bacterium RifOxyA12_full_50_37]|uniref:Uncharacterized protein n=1 Tax=Candidatus Raymondbacteria bacterium RIFOXYD12_FULL_49_13 TaxID=1817890 RepID=A0A1F7FDT5_UNCRA|nr:MAG: hypothetical protein A2268_05025 [Candidatus Raymondbacteria bacterium RifOxyA12_full_50_37]OGJ94106.1 MAG: hypothetical protein A2248_12230 [Candidatus Raymondbacteria bacterium RIFOXYA2_FULL_49_16]OGJ94311.1 MAG: hypothetical protein A2350_00975 [Candidatus Raymondbacteria bacterium RifOxyB12_full_50_8]OGJ96931.1 MAG: hypothetical protein A2453_04830 [Candidatus Raymondbacteria bacterium RIFOXYC2_FULL_50_21]OGK04657.1 MAG: hypothetical protein A2519_20995 [Candidatus Raymondbacteria b
MPKLHRFIKVKKEARFFEPHVSNALLQMGANLGDGKLEGFQVVNVNAKNRESVIKYLEENGYSIEDTEQ